MKDWTKYQKEPDKFDFWLLKYGEWIRIGDNRTYVKYDKQNSEFHFLILYHPDLYEMYIEAIEKGIITEEIFKRDTIRSLTVIAEYVRCKPEDFYNSCLYTMAGHYADERRIGVNNRDLYNKYYQELVVQVNKN